MSLERFGRCYYHLITSTSTHTAQALSLLYCCTSFVLSVLSLNCKCFPSSFDLNSASDTDRILTLQCFVTHSYFSSDNTRPMVCTVPVWLHYSQCMYSLRQGSMCSFSINDKGGGGVLKIQFIILLILWAKVLNCPCSFSMDWTYQCAHTHGHTEFQASRRSN